MKKFLLQVAGLALITGLLLTTGCTEDTSDPGGGSDIPPLISLASEIDFVSTDTEVAPGSTFKVKLRLQTGTNPLRTVEIREDNEKLPFDRFTVNDGAIGSNNPFLITGPSTSGATYEIEIVAHDGLQETKVYTFEVTDEGNLTDAVSLNITTTGQEVKMLEGVLFNQAGPVGTGGLDLDSGNGTGSMDAEAEIRDMGLDCTVPAPGLNWRRQIGSVNGADLREVDLTQVENFSFDNVNFVEEIIGAYETGLELSDGEAVDCSDASTTNVTDVSDEVMVGDLFTVKSGDTYYLIRIDEVNETAADNADNYVISIKF